MRRRTAAAPKPDRRAAPVVDPKVERARDRAALAFVERLERERLIVRCPACGCAGSLVRLPARCSCGCAESRERVEVRCSWCETVSERLPTVNVGGRAVRAWATRPMGARLVERGDAAQEGD